MTYLKNNFGIILTIIILLLFIGGVGYLTYAVHIEEMQRCKEAGGELIYDAEKKQIYCNIPSAWWPF